MPGSKEKQEISVVGRLLSLEALVFLMGVASLFYGIVTGDLWQAVLGAGIIVLVVLILLVSRGRRNFGK